MTDTKSQISAGTDQDAPSGKVLKQDLPKDHPDATIQITLKFSNADLKLIGDAADARRIPRASFMRQAIFEYIKKV